MALWQNIPFAMILLPLASAAFTSVMKGRWARRTALCVIALTTLLSGLFCIFMKDQPESFNFMMGHFPAPWGNEIRAGMLEAVTALCFNLVMLLSVAGGMKKVTDDIDGHKQNLYYIMTELLTSALMAQVFTNDVFTAYVFLEIMTIAACALIASRVKGNALVAATRYMILNLVGSGLFLLGLTLLYDLTGHLLMQNIREEIIKLAATGQYQQPLTVVIALITIGLGIKSALYPFHTWVPDAYTSSTPTSAALLFSLVSKGYIFLVIKFFYRVFGLDVILNSRVADVLFVFGIVGMIMGSLGAIRQRDIRRMVAYSSVAQIGYIYMGMGLNVEAGMVAALFHMFSHLFLKAMLFIATGGLRDASGHMREFHELRGAGYRCPVAGVAFTVGALGMIGIPFLGGFAAKVLFAQAAMEAATGRMIIVLITLALSTALNAVYFGKTILTLYRLPAEEIPNQPRFKPGMLFTLSCGAFIAVNVFLGVCAQPVIQAIADGLKMFG
ncbi:MAG: sodium:proton antiporter [Clostridia bacterium]|nr:sodium:proton antiporter [Clostridia bacterium]